MKKITFILVSLCVIATLFSAVACNDGTTTDANVGSEDTQSPETTQNIDSTTAEDTEEVKVEDTEDDVYISISPSDEGQEWGDLNISGN
ncbi:MAG: hypothetical protein II297_04945 [Clostridia bacterium]|nr:hypothetical protein [Clostridia bacterium]